VGEQAREVELSETQRLETFSDGVFAIAITLLVLEIKVPPAVASAGETIVPLGQALRGLWPSFLGYALSFGTIGIMWVNHHAMFQHIRKTDRAFLLINVLFLMCISFIPFSTALLAEHLRHQPGERTATLFYGATFLAMAILYNAVWRYGVHGARLLGDDVDRAAVDAISRRYRWGPAAYLVAMLLAFVSPAASIAAQLALAALYCLPERRATR
jgi:uncharacterized membrane protein